MTMKSFWDLGKILKKFWRTEKFSVNLEHIFLKLGTFRKIGTILGNFGEMILKSYEKLFVEIRSKFCVTSRKIWGN